MKVIFSICCFIILSVLQNGGSLLAQRWGEASASLTIPESAEMAVDGEQNIYLIHQDQTGITKYLAAYQYDSILTIGGRSHRQEGFLEIIDMDVSNRQSVFVLDQGRQRISMLHPNLRVLQDLNLTAINASPGAESPDDLLIQSLAANSAGELFLLNLLDNRIYVLSTRGEWSVVFGGTDYGPGALFAPTTLSLSPDNFLFVAQPDFQNIKVFDLFGTWRYDLETPDGFEWVDFQLAGEVLILHGDKELMVLDPRTNGSMILPYPVDEVQGLFWGKNHVYFMTKNQVHLYPVPKRD